MRAVKLRWQRWKLAAHRGAVPQEDGSRLRVESTKYLNAGSDKVVFESGLQWEN